MNQIMGLFNQRKEKPSVAEKTRTSVPKAKTRPRVGSDGIKTRVRAGSDGVAAADSPPKAADASPKQVSEHQPVNPLSKGDSHGAHMRRTGSKKKTTDAATAKILAAEYSPEESSKFDFDDDYYDNSRQSSKISRQPSKSSTRHNSKTPASLAILARQFHLPLDTLQESSKLFCAYAELPNLSENEDIHRDGILGTEQMKALICKLTGYSSFEQIAPEVQDKVLAADTNLDGHVDFHEFTCWYHNRSFLEFVNLTKAEMDVREVGHRLGVSVTDMEHFKRMYDKFDLDGSGSIELDEFRELMHILMKVPKDMRIPESRIMHFWTECDIDGSGDVDLEEFVTFYLKHFDEHAEEPLHDFYQAIRRVH